MAAPQGTGYPDDGARRGTYPGRSRHKSAARDQALKPDFPQLQNLRDLGGFPTTDGQITRSGSLLRADDLVHLDAQGVRALSEYGVRTVLDMRWPEESALHPSPVPQALPEVRYARISLLMLSETEWRLRGHEGAKEQWKCLVLERARPELRQVLSFIAAASPAPLLFHCVAGKDRTGLIAALMLALAKVTPQAIARDYALSSQQLRESYLRRYASDQPERILEALRCPEEGAHNMLNYLEDAGGIRAYLELVGLTEAEIARLWSRLRD